MRNLPWPWLCLALLFLPAAGCDPPADDDDSSDDDDDDDVADDDDDVVDDDDDVADDDDVVDDDDDTSNPTPSVVSNSPLAGATNVTLNVAVTVTFSELMDSDALEDAFTLTSGAPPVAVPTTLVLAGEVAAFWPTLHLLVDTVYTATVTTAAESEAGVALVADHAWTFTTGDAFAPGLPIPLGMAGDFAVLAKSGISSVPASAITGDIGVSPAAATYITGFSLSADASNEFATSPQVTGRVYAADYSPPTPAQLTQAVGDMELAFVDAAGRAPDVTELGAGDIGGMNLEPGVYAWSTGLLIPVDVTLTGSATEVWVFSVAQDLTVSSGAQVLLAGGAVPENIFWQVAGAVDLGTTAHLEGVVLTQTAVTLRTGASINGRLLAQTAVDIDGATVVEPGQ